MKDYYYILGIKKNATSDEIKKAYRKLSLKFHPDKNDGDDFFTERFKEIQEAYETLTDDVKRSIYENQFSNNRQNGTANNGYNFDPIIEYFKASKLTFEFDQEITFSWKTINSDKIIIKPFGNVQPIGQKTYRIKDFKNPILSFELIAENTNIGRQTKQILKLNNKTFQELYSYFKKLIEDESKFKNNTYSSGAKNSANEKKPNFVKIGTNKGIVELEPYINMTGTKAFMSGKPAPDGKYKVGWFDYFIVKNGIIIKS